MTRFDGDPRIIADKNGVSLQYQGGQPVMDGGIENAIIISLITATGWVGNYLFETSQEKIGSDFLSVTKGTLTLSKLAEIGRSAKRALQWMIDAGIASNVDAVAKNPTGSRIETTITVAPVGKDIEEFLVTRNAENWTIQKTDPAYERLI